MKRPGNSLAYVWAKHTLSRGSPTWLSWMFLSLAVLSGLTALYFRGMNFGFMVATAGFAFMALDAWCKRGFHEVHEEQERLLEEMRSRKMPNKSPEPTSGTVTPPAEPGVAPVPPVAHL